MSSIVHKFKALLTYFHFVNNKITWIRTYDEGQAINLRCYQTVVGVVSSVGFPYTPTIIIIELNFFSGLILTFGGKSKIFGELRSLESLAF